MEAHQATTITDPDEKRLAELGYRQDLSRAWSGFQNFAISFTIISILAGTFTSYAQAWNNGGPVVISWGWILISIPILIVGFCMSELVSAYPTAGGIYWWATKLGGPAWGWFTGWFNLIGLVAVVASVDYACAIFLNALLGLYGLDLGFVNFGDTKHILTETFGLFVVILILHTVVNIFTSHLVAIFNSISVFWHVIGVTALVAVFIFVPAHHQSFSFVFGHRINNSGFSDSMYWFYILPLGFLLTQYTITGFDASAHISEETHEASMGAAKGVWRSIFYSALIGWVVLLALTFAATHVGTISSPKNGYGAGSAIAIFTTALTSAWAKFVLIVCVVGQLFCGMSCLTSASRMCYAFSRDGALPGWRIWSKVNQRRIPFNAVILMAVAALVITLPALPSNKDNYPYAFFAVVSITVIGLYIAYVIPIFLRWRAGDSFETGPWTLGKKYKWMNLFATCWVGFITIIFCLPFVPAAVPGNKDFDWKFVNYAPIMVGGLILIVGVWWLVSARHKFTGPRRTIDEIDVEIAGEPAPSGPAAP